MSFNGRLRGHIPLCRLVASKSICWICVTLGMALWCGVVLDSYVLKGQGMTGVDEYSGCNTESVSARLVDGRLFEKLKFSEGLKYVVHSNSTGSMFLLRPDVVHSFS